MIPILAQIGGDAMIHNLLVLVVVLACIGIIWAIVKAAGPDPAVYWWIRFVFLICVGILIINFLLALIGHPLVRW